MKYYPVHLDVREKPCLVVGGGRVGLRKTLTLLDCGARVSVVSREFDPDFIPLTNSADLLEKEYDNSDIEGMFLVFAATDNKQVNGAVKKDAHMKNILCNIADDPDDSNFILPSIIRQGDLVLTVSTSGKSPALAKALRRDLERQFGSEYADFLILMGRLRHRLLKEKHAPKAHGQIFRQIIQSRMLDLVQEKNTPAIDRLLAEITGMDITSDSLLAERID